MNECVLLSVLAVAIKMPSVFAGDISTRIVGGKQAEPGNYPYFGKQYPLKLSPFPRFVKRKSYLLQLYCIDPFLYSPDG